MPTNGIATQTPTSTSTTASSRHRNSFISGMMVRLLIAFAISWLIVLAFFVTGVISH